MKGIRKYHISIILVVSISVLYQGKEMVQLIRYTIGISVGFISDNFMKYPISCI